MIADLGVEAVALEGLSFPEQASLFANADVIMGLHGAGLANLAFTRPGTLTVELLPPRLDLARTVLFWTIGAIMSNRYAQLVCPGAPDQNGAEWSTRDITVDCAHFRTFLTRVGITPRAKLGH